MSSYLGGLTSFSVEFDASTDIITSQGQKLKLASSGNVVLNRPGQFRIQRLGAIAEMELVLDGEQLTIYGMNINGYYQIPVATIDEAIDKVRDDIGFEAPGADILSSNPFDMEVTDVTSGDHIGMTTIGGETVHHLAFRGDQVDWQIWVLDGDAPLPLKYVITSKLHAGAPEYSVDFTNWNTEPQLDGDSFMFTPPSDAKKIKSLTIDQTGNISNYVE